MAIATTEAIITVETPVNTQRRDEIPRWRVFQNESVVVCYVFH